MKTIHSFGESKDGKIQWYAEKDEKRIPCDEQTIQKIWDKWIMAEGAEKKWETNMNIYLFTKEPLTINI